MSCKRKTFREVDDNFTKPLSLLCEKEPNQFLNKTLVQSPR